jgi:EAL domain-containing protein (putative c-di-GMP-specific phosphodiesterase class I)/GGDEF domain-containing protein
MFIPKSDLTFIGATKNPRPGNLMSLSKQLLTLVSALFLLIFSLNFFLSVKNIRDYLQGEAKIHAQDTATSLGLSISPHIGNPHDPSIKAMVSAIFDMGYYKEIRLIDNNSIELISLKSDKNVEGVPGWFIDFLPISAATGSSEISSGWQISGVVHVTVNPNYAYLKLYSQVKSTYYYSLAAFITSIILLSLVLRITLGSLKKIDQMALALADGDFVTLQPLPWTGEVRNVAKSMNLMSQKIQSTFNTLNSQLQSLGNGLLRDDLTGLYKKSVFESDLYHCQNDPNDSFLILLKFDSLSELAKFKDNQTIDSYLKGFAEILQNATHPASKYTAKAYRFYGAEFALLVSESSIPDLENLVADLSNKFAELGQAYQHPDLVHIGVVSVHSTSTLDTILRAAYEAYEQAKLIGPNRYFIRKSDTLARNLEDWRNLVCDCIENRHYSVNYINHTQDSASAELLIEEITIDIIDNQSLPVSVAAFVAIAEKIGKIIELDKNMIMLALERIGAEHQQHGVAVNLSTLSIKDAHFRLWLAHKIQQNPGSAERLVFSLSAYAVSKDIAAYQEFIELIHQWHCKVMIKRFESTSIASDILQKLKPDYIRLALALTNAIAIKRTKQEFVQTLHTLAGLMGTQILAEAINDDNDLRTLKSIGVLCANS